MIIDEVGQLGNFDALLRSFTFGRGAGVRAWALFQDAGQITRNSGPTGLQGFMGSAALRQFFGVRDYQTAQMVSAKRKVIQKMRARVEKGYHVFPAPVGYRYKKDRVHGKILTRVEPIASILADALEGFANCRFASQYEVKRFLEGKPEFPKSGKSGYVHPSKVKAILQRSVYAGVVEAPCWGVSMRKGHHEPLISMQTYERIQSVLKSKVYAPARKDISEVFPLRGFVHCDDCGHPMTSCWSKGRNKHYPYYLCDTPKCPSNRKSIPRARVEDGAEALLRSLEPAIQLFTLARIMFADAWDMRLTQA